MLSRQKILTHQKSARINYWLLLKLDKTPSQKDHEELLVSEYKKLWKLVTVQQAVQTWLVVVGQAGKAQHCCIMGVI